MSEIDTGFEEGEIRTNNNNIIKSNISHSELNQIKENKNFNQYESITNKKSFFQTTESNEQSINRINNKYNFSSRTDDLVREENPNCLDNQEISFSSGNYFDVNSLATVIVYLF